VLDLLLAHERTRLAAALLIFALVAEPATGIRQLTARVIFQ
jgi:hypothetical protein